MPVIRMQLHLQRTTWWNSVNLGWAGANKSLGQIRFVLCLLPCAKLKLTFALCKIEVANPHSQHSAANKSQKLKWAKYEENKAIEILDIYGLDNNGTKILIIPNQILVHCHARCFAKKTTQIFFKLRNEASGENLLA